MSWDYANYEFLISATLLVVTMFGMGWTLTVRDFLGVARAPRGIVLVLVVQVLISPLLAILLARILVVPHGIAIGMLLVAALPGGMFSNFLTHLGKGNVALSVAATAVCSLGCLVTTSFVLKTFGATRLPDDFAMPASRILSDIVLYLLLPLVAGMIGRRLRPERRSVMVRYCTRISIALLILMIVAATASGRLHLLAYGWRAPLAMVLFGAGSIWICYGLGILLRMRVKESYTAVIEVVVRNSHLGVMLKASLFPADGDDAVADAVLFTVLFYGFVSLALGLYEVVARRLRMGIHAWDESLKPEPVPPA